MKKICYTDPEELVNFREIKAGNIAKGILYRSSYPLSSNSIIRDKISKHAESVGIKCVLNLQDHVTVLELNTKDALWYNTLVKEKKVIALNMDMNIPGHDFNQKLKKGLQFMISHSGPYLIHCFAGVDRTGFTAAILEAVMGASIEEIYYDYTASFLCFERGEDDHYIKEKIVKKLEKLHNDLPVTDENIQAAAEYYLLCEAGLSKAELSALKMVLS
jgi:protein tyrosine/serine phosphatase